MLLLLHCTNLVLGGCTSMQIKVEAFPGEMKKKGAAGAKKKGAAASAKKKSAEAGSKKQGSASDSGDKKESPKPQAA